MKSFDLFFYAILGEILGISFFFKGFSSLRQKRIIQNVPTSTIRAIPIGEVEIKGKSRAKYPLKTPLSSLSCVFFKYIEEEFRKVGKTYKWVKILETQSDYPFYIYDDTGAVMVNPSGAELMLVNKSIKTEGKIRKTEFYILENEKIYVLGKAIKLPSRYETEREIVAKKFQEIMENPEEKIKLDKNQDMWIDENEIKEKQEEIRQNVKEQIEETFEENNDNIVTEHLKDVIIGKSEYSPFIISTMEEQHLVNHLKSQTIIMVYGGGLLIIGCLWIILKYVNQLKLK